jgi:serine/threonine protein kinase
VGDKWRLSDFGLVKVIGKNSVMDTINLTGTAGYAPPEAYQGKVATAWDLWSLGIIIVEALTGRFPFSGNTLQELQYQVCNQEPNLSGLPQNLEPIVRGCLRKKRESRWTAKQVLDVLYRNTKKLKNVDKSIDQDNTYPDLWEKEQVLESYEKANKSYQEQGETYRYEHMKNQTNRVPISKIEEIHPDDWGKSKGIWGWFSSLFDDK